MGRPRRFADSSTTHEATFFVDVVKRYGEATEAVILRIDCAGAVSFDEDAIDSFDEDAIDVVIEALGRVRDNLRARR